MITMEEINSSEFWKRISDSNPYQTLSGLASNAGVNYDYLRQQKSHRKIPNSITLYRLSIAIGKSMEYLITGIEEKKMPSLSPRIRRIVLNLIHVATEEDMRLVERILRIQNTEETYNAECI